MHNAKTAMSSSADKYGESITIDMEAVIARGQLSGAEELRTA